MAFLKTSPLLIALVSTSFVATGQKIQTPSPQASGQVIGAHTIDGSVHPELIPDSVANRLIFMSLVLPENPTKIDMVKQGVRIRRLQLNRTDFTQFTALLKKFSDAHNKWQSQLSTQDPVAAGSDKNRMISDFLFLTQQHLSPLGFESFQKYVQAEKKKMTMPQ